ncbi:MAG: histidinol-phosphate transaminase [Parvularculaceae bacterium]
MTSLTPKPGILDIRPYKPGASEAPGAAKVYKLSSNESALGASPKAIEAYKSAASSLHLYPDGAARSLREKIGEAHGLDPARIVCGAGSDELLQLLCRAYAGEGDNIVQTEHGFLVYAIAAKACGAEPLFAKEKHLTADVDEIIASVNGRTRIVFLANPNNPTGTYISREKLRTLRRNLCDDILLVIDSAYAEYMEMPDYDAGAALVDDHDNVVMTRTFSKIYGLAALRLGWAYCPDAVADVLNRIRGPFNVAAPALAAGAAALEDQEFVVLNRAHNWTERAHVGQELDRLGISFQPGFGNFLLVNFASTPGENAASVQAYLKANGVLVREMGPYGLDDWLRVTVGTEEANRRFIALLEEKFNHGG